MLFLNVFENFLEVIKDGNVPTTQTRRQKSLLILEEFCVLLLDTGPLTLSRENTVLIFVSNVPLFWKIVLCYISYGISSKDKYQNNQNSRRREEKGGSEFIWKVIAKNFSKLERLWHRDSQGNRPPYYFNAKRPPGYIIIKLSKIKYKEGILMAGEKRIKPIKEPPLVY